MEEIFAGIVFMVLVFSLFPLLWWRRRRVARSGDEDEAEAAPVVKSRALTLLIFSVELKFRLENVLKSNFPL